MVFCSVDTYSCLVLLFCFLALEFCNDSAATTAAGVAFSWKHKNNEDFKNI